MQDDELEKDTHFWRSDTLRQLHPWLGRDRAHRAAARANFDKYIEKLSSDRAQEFLNGPAKFLISQESIEKAATKLTEIYKRAAKLSHYVWVDSTVSP